MRNLTYNHLYRLFIFIFLWIGAHEIQADITHFTPIVLSKIPHDTAAFTQGLAIEDDCLYESTGLEGYSSLRCIELATGKLLQKQQLSSKVFAEGIAAFPDRLIQISWMNQQAFIYDRLSLNPIKVISYRGKGWGLCRDGDKIWMSDGSPTLRQCDPDTFTVLKKLNVQRNGRPLSDINDLDCVGNLLYANVWQKKFIVQIDKKTGQVVGIIDLSQLLSKEENARLGPEDVLNGIAYRAKTGTFYITGKRWPWIFEVLFERVL